MGCLIVTGTGTGVGKTVVAAALAGRAAAKRGHRVAVVKPVQTGLGPGAPGDLGEITRLSGVQATHEFARCLDGRPAIDLADVVRRIVDLDAMHDMVIVDGTGGLLEPFTGNDTWTLADLAATLRAPALVVTATGTDAANHAALTIGRLAEDGIALAGIVIGRWPASPDAPARLSVGDLASLAPDGRLAGVLPAGIATVPNFRQLARAALSARFGGTFDPAAFVTAMR